MKSAILKTLIYLLLIAVFDVIFVYSVDIETCNHSILAAAIGLNVAYLSLLLIPLLAPRQKGQMVISATLYLIGVFYFISEVIAATAFMIWPPENIIWPIAVQAVLFVIYLILLLSSTLANDATQNALNVQREQSCTIRERAERIAEIMYTVKSHESAKLLERCYNEAKNSPLKSCAEVAGIENEIDSLIMLINDYAVDNNTEELNNAISRLRNAIQKRNNKLKYQQIF